MTKKSKSLSKGGIFYLFYQVLNLAFPLITGIYVTHILLPDKIGTVAAAQNLTNYFVILAFLGIPTYGLREIAKCTNRPEERSKVFSELFVINSISTTFFLIVYLIIIFSVPEYRSELPLYLITGISIALNFFNVSWLFEGMEDFQFISVRNFIFKIISFTLLVIFVRSKDDILIYALITVCGTAGNYIVNMACSGKYVKFSFRNLNLKRHIKSVIYLVAVNLAIEIYSLMDITMMNFWCTKDSIAFYKYGHTVETMLLQVVNTFTMVLIPRISLCYNEKKFDEFNRLLSKGFKLIILFAVPMIIGIMFTADFLMVHLYGQAYIVSSYILKLFSILLLVSPIGYLLGSRVMLVTGNESKMIISVGIGAAINFVGNYLMIPHYHEYGATIASLLSEFVVMIIYVNLGKKFFKLQNIKGTVVRIIASSAVMVGVLFLCEFLPDGWAKVLIQVAVASLAYVVALLLMKEDIVTSYFNVFMGKIKRRIG